MAKLSKLRVSQGFFERKVTLATSVTQQIWKRTQRILPRAFYQLSVNIRFIQEADEVESLDAQVKALLEGFEGWLEGIVKGHEAVMEEKGIEPLQGYSAPMLIVVNVTSPRLNRCLNQLQRIDHLINCVESLWMAGIYDDARHHAELMRVQREAVHQYQRLANCAHHAIKSARGKVTDRRAAANEKAHEGEMRGSALAQALTGINALGGAAGAVAPAPATEPPAALPPGTAETAAPARRRAGRRSAQPAPAPADAEGGPAVEVEGADSRPGAGDAKAEDGALLNRLRGVLGKNAA